MNRVDKTPDQYNENDKEYGGQPMSGKDMLDSHMNTLASDIEKYIGKSTNEAYRPLGEMGYMPFEDTMKDWIGFNPDKRTEFDATISSGLAVMACQKEKYKKTPKKRSDVNITTFVKKYSNT